MEIIFLGTSAGTPTKARNVSAVAIKKANSKLWSLIDCGEATQHQILHTKLSLNNLESIFITHVHGDHCFGLPGLLASASLAGRTTPLTIIAPALIQNFIENTQRISSSNLSYKINFIHVEECREYTGGEDVNYSPLKRRSFQTCYLSSKLFFFDASSDIASRAFGPASLTIASTSTI